MKGNNEMWFVGAIRIDRKDNRKLRIRLDPGVLHLVWLEIFR